MHDRLLCDIEISGKTQNCRLKSVCNFKVTRFYLILPCKQHNWTSGVYSIEIIIFSEYIYSFINFRGIRGYIQWVQVRVSNSLHPYKHLFKPTAEYVIVLWIHYDRGNSPLEGFYYANKLDRLLKLRYCFLLALGTVKRGVHDFVLTAVVTLV